MAALRARTIREHSPIRCTTKAQSGTSGQIGSATDKIAQTKDGEQVLSRQGQHGDCMGLTDLKVVFDWLAHNHVKKIIRVIVVGDGEISHSDQEIEDALERFEVEVWDWKKLDICSETILKAAGNAREVHLHRE